MHACEYKNVVYFLVLSKCYNVGQGRHEEFFEVKLHNFARKGIHANTYFQKVRSTLKNNNVFFLLQGGKTSITSPSVDGQSPTVNTPSHS